MQLIPAKCPDCGADLKIPEGSSSVICEYCGGNIIVTDVLGTTSVMQNCMMLAYSALESNNYKDAYDHFNRAIEIDLKNPNAWFGKGVCIGMIGKIRDNSFGQMIDLFESAFKYAPADKQSNLKKNAAAEIVKVMRNSAKIIQFSNQLLLLGNDDKLYSEISNEVKKVKDIVTKTVQKAQEYDSSNKDVTVLLDEVTSGMFFNPDQDMKSQSMETFQSGEYKPITTEPGTPQTTTEGQPSGNQAGNKKKSGCLFVIIILVMTVAAASLLLGV
jgi:ribosomal protein S27E